MYKPINIHSEWEYGFRLACECGHYDIVQYLVNLYCNDNNYKIINIHIGDEYGFRYACKNRYYDIAQYLVNLYHYDTKYTMINIHSKNEDVLINIHTNHNKMVKFLLTLYKKKNKDDCNNYKPINNYLLIFKKFDKYLL